MQLAVEKSKQERVKEQFNEEDKDKGHNKMNYILNLEKRTLLFYLTLILITTAFLLTFSTKNVGATGNVESELSQNEINNLHHLGFSEEAAKKISLEEYNTYYKNLNAIEEPVAQEKYYKIVTNVLEPDKPEEIQEFTKAEALIEMIKEENQIKPRAIDTEKNSWLTMTLTSTKLSNGRTLLKNEFTWLKTANIALTDAVGITYGSGAVAYKDTFHFRYIFTNAYNESTYYTQKEFSSNSYGVVAKFDLKGISQKAHTGYLAFQVESNGSSIKNNAYGHYTHTTIALSGSVSIKTGDISLGWATKESKVPNTMITFNY